MPFTPFHFGPGFFIKSVLTKRFSFRVFALVNIIMDIEPLYFIVTNQWPVHRVFHTYFGATIIAIGCIALGGLIRYPLIDGRIPKAAFVTSAFIGTYSHVLLDSIMHTDMLPFYPVAKSNYLLHTLNYGQLHLLCVLSGVIGLVVYCCMRKNEMKE